MWSRVLSIAILGWLAHPLNTQEQTCGRRPPSHVKLIEGRYTADGPWPWHAAIYLVGIDEKGLPFTTTGQRNDIPRYACGGSLIDTNTFLTAAHCVCLNYNQALNAENVLVSLGKRNLTEISISSFLQVRHIIRHPNYDSQVCSNDIAIIKLMADVTFTNLIAPICLWDAKKPTMAELIGTEGTIVGWGRTSTTSRSDILREAKFPVVSFGTCLASDRAFFSAYLSDYTFCAGYRNGTSPCNGDSGGALTFDVNDVFYIRGTVSLTKGRKGIEGDQMVCDPNHYTLFTDAAQYLTWIVEAKFEKKVFCESLQPYAYGDGLECRINVTVKLIEQNCKIIIEYSPNPNVTAFGMDGHLEAVPDLTDIFEKFANITSFQLIFSKIHFLDRKKFFVARRTKTLDFSNNGIYVLLSSDIFDDMTELETIFLFNNQLQVIHPDLFKELQNLESIYLNNNHIMFLPVGLFRNNRKLRIINLKDNRLQHIATDFRDLPALYWLDLQGNWCINEFSLFGSISEFQAKIRNQCY